MNAPKYVYPTDGVSAFRWQYNNPDEPNYWVEGSDACKNACGGCDAPALEPIPFYCKTCGWHQQY